MPADPARPAFETRTADWLSPRDALARVLRHAEPLPAESVEPGAAPGRALAEALTASTALPPWDNSAMDGYAVRSEDVRGASASEPVSLRVTGAVRAGEPPSVSVGPGEAVRIMTGAPVPDGADSVVRVEDTDAEETEGVVRVQGDRDAGRNVRAGGADTRPGDVVLQRGHTVRPGSVATLAALGLTRIAVHARPTVAVLVTGDELRRTDDFDDVRAGRAIPESNGPMLAAALSAIGARADLLPIAADTEQSLRESLEAAREADALVTVGGASMGEADLVKRVLDAEGFRLDFWRVRMRPGSPFGFGLLPRGDRAQPVFGLPGNPASAFVTYELFVRPFVLRLGGHRRVLRRVAPCVAGEDLAGPPGLTHYPRVALARSGPDLVARTTGSQSSGLVRTLRDADGLAVVPEDADGVRKGEPVDVILLDHAPAACEPAAVSP